MTATNKLQRECPPCPQCDSNSVHLTLLSSERHLCRCDVCGFTWNEPATAKIAKDRRRYPRREFPE